MRGFAKVTAVLRLLRRTLLAVSACIAAACGSGPTTPPPPPAAPTLSCPAPLTFESPNNVPLPVSFQVPTASGGQSPVNVTCSAQSGATFPLGNTLVTCTATDALQRTASCNFNVAVTAAPRISKTKFLAFGDSITNGRCGPDGLTCPHYASRLEVLLAQRYASQSSTIRVTESGIPGENASDDITTTVVDTNGQDRLRDLLPTLDVEVLLLMEGTNDLLNGPTNTAVALAEAALDVMVMRARGLGKEVFLATIPPMRYPPPPGTIRDRSDSGPLVPLLNDRIRAIAAARGATLVDIYAALNADLNGTISVDNLHPNDHGMQVIADTFFAAIRQTLDVTPGAPAPLFRR